MSSLIYQYSSMATNLYIWFFVSKSLLGIAEQKKLYKICHFVLKALETC